MHPDLKEGSGKSDHKVSPSILILGFTLESSGFKQGRIRGGGRLGMNLARMCLSEVEDMRPFPASRELNEIRKCHSKWV